MNHPYPEQSDMIEENLSDADLVERARQGSLGSYEALIRRYNQRLFRVARAVATDDASARDAMQEGYIKAFQRLAQLQVPENIASWLAQIIRNEALMARRKNWRELTLDEPLDPQTFDEKMLMGMPADTPETHAIRRQWRVILEAAIDRLSDDLRETFVLRAVQGLSVKEVAELVDVAPGTVKSRFARARAALREDITRGMETPLEEVYSFDGAACDRLTRQVLARIARLQPK